MSQVRELVDLPVADDMRCGYLNVLHVLLRNSPWVQQGSYRVLDIYNALASPSPRSSTRMPHAQRLGARPIQTALPQCVNAPRSVCAPSCALRPHSAHLHAACLAAAVSGNNTPPHRSTCFNQRTTTWFHTLATSSRSCSTTAESSWREAAMYSSSALCQEL